MMQPFNDPSFPQEKLTDLQAALTSARVRLMMKRDTAFWSAMLSQMLVEITAEIPTAATNARKIYMNPYFCSELSVAQLLGLMLHELMHTVYGHVDHERLKELGIDLKLHNMAGDHRINNDIKLWQFELPEGGLCDTRFRDPQYWSTMKIYEELEQENAQQSPQYEDFVMDVMDIGGECDEEGAGGPSKDELREDLNQRLLRAVQAAERMGQPGSIPASVKRHLDDYLNPKLPWQQILAHHVDPYAKDDYSMSRPNRRYHHMYLPSLRSDQLKQMTVGFDVSGSMSPQDLQECTSEVQHIWTNLKPQRLRIMSFDTAVHCDEVIAPGDAFSDVELMGGGGTNVEPFIKSIREDEPELAIIFSDGYFYMPDMGNLATDLIWIILNNPEFKAPYGTVIYLD
jgi:predicted metal-dependent peptidase